MTIGLFPKEFFRLAMGFVFENRIFNRYCFVLSAVLISNCSISSAVRQETYKVTDEKL